MTRMQGPSSESSPRPTAANFPFLIVTDDTIELAPSRVWIRPLTNLTSRAPAQRSSSPSRAEAGAITATVANNDNATNKETRTRAFMAALRLEHHDIAAVEA
jgi:hypothetical protein